MTDLFGGGTSKASKKSQEAQKQQNFATQRFIEQQAGLARGDIMSLFPQAQEAARGGFQGALNLIGAGVNPQISAFQQGNVGAQGILNQGMGGFQNAILGLPVEQFAPQTVNVDTSFLRNVQLPELPAQPTPSVPPSQVSVAPEINQGSLARLQDFFGQRMF